MKRAKRDGKKEEKEKKASSKAEPQISPARMPLGLLLVCTCVSLCGLAVGSSPSFYSEVEGKTSIFVRLPFFFVTQALFNELCLGLGLQLARWIRGDSGILPWHATKDEAIQHDTKIPWPACEIPEALQGYRGRPGQPFFLNHVTGRQRCKDACMRLGMGVGALLGVWFMCRCMDRRDLSSLGFTLDSPFFQDAAAGLVVGVTIVSFMFAVELVAGWVIFLQWFEVFDKSENFAVCIFWDVLFHLNVAVNEELPVRGWLLNRSLGVCRQEDRAAMAEEGDAPKKRTFKKYSYRGIDLDKLLDMSNQDLMELFCARQRRKFSRGIKRKPITVLKKLRKAKRETAYGEKPEAVKTHLRNMVIVPEMIGSVVGVYNGKQYINVEIKPEMIGHYLGEFSITYKPIKHGRAGMMGKNSQFVYNIAEASMAHWQLPATAAFLFAMVLESVFFVLMHLPSPGGTRPLSMINIFVGGMAGGLNVLLTGGRLGFALGWHFGCGFPAHATTTLGGEAMDKPVLLSLYIWEGCMQGIAFETIPALLRKNSWAVSKGESDENERLLNYSEVPFQIKFLLCFFVERQGAVWRLESREAKLVILLSLSGFVLLACSSAVVEMLASQPPDLWSLVPLIGMLAALTALADILMDGWGVEKLRPEHASLCQGLGLELGRLGANEVFFHLKDPKTMELLSVLFRAAGMLSVAIAGCLYLRIPGNRNAAAQGRGFRHQVTEVFGFLTRSVRARYFLGLLLLLNFINGHVDFQSQRYDAFGLTPEKLAFFNMLVVPVSFCTAYFMGTADWPAHRLRSLYFGLVILNFASIWHLRACQTATAETLEAGSLYWTYAGLTVARKLISDSIFVVEVSIINGLAATRPLMSGSIISVLASASNFCGSLPEQWMPTAIASLGLEWTVTIHTTLGLVAVVLLVPLLG
ncbi:40S ribosomal protein S15 [Symbiodinium microadriaticum]|uniref:40S ribosomal protein S15 n=1 Tax=Symbiodinium microadriaticum TaxID=2951 RepID=A0A1Q9EHH8_SYMMI|nr:40S ribosomal protein S15 [Symbiodinium microadriaticum]